MRLLRSFTGTADLEGVENQNKTRRQTFQTPLRQKTIWFGRFVVLGRVCLMDFMVWFGVVRLGTILESCRWYVS